jgi:hypothetical protein
MNLETLFLMHIFEKSLGFNIGKSIYLLKVDGDARFEKWQKKQ